MRVGFNASFLRKPYTGIGQVTRNFLLKLNDFRIQNKIFETTGIDFQDVEFFAYTESPIDISLPENFHRREFLPLWKRDDLFRKIWWEKHLLPKRVKADQCDVFVSLYQSPTTLRENIPHIMLVHDLVPRLFPEYLDNWRKKYYQNLTEDAVKYATKIMTVSRRTEKDLIRNLGIFPDKISTNYIDTGDDYRKKPSAAETKRVMAKYNLRSGYILNAGGLEKRKNVEGLIRAYKILLEQNKKVRFAHSLPPLVIAGKLMPRLAPLVTDAEKLVRNLNLTSHVKLLDFVEQEDLPALYHNAAVFIYPSFYEGFGLPVLEAMRQGVPVITSKKSSLPEVGGDGVLYCNPEEAEDIAMVIKNILFNNKLREVLTARTKDQALKFSWEKFIVKLFATIKNLADNAS